MMGFLLFEGGQKMMMQGQPQPGQGQPQGAGGGQPQVVQELRQMDHEQLVSLAAQAITRLQQIEQQMGGGQPQGGQPQGGQTPPMG